MIRALIAFALIGAVLFAGNWLLDHPGNVSIALPGFFSIEWSFAWAMTLLGAALVLAVIAAAVLYLIIGAPWRISRRFEQRRREKGQTAISLGMVAVAAGDRQEAMKQSGRATALLPNRPMTTLLAAQSAQLNGDNQAAQRFFSQLAEQPEAAFLGLRGLWMQAMKDGRTRDALHFAKLAHDQQPNSVWVLDSLFELQTRLGRWDEAHKTLTALSRTKSHPADKLEHDSALVNIERSRLAVAAGDKAEALQIAQAAFKKLPEFPPAVAQVAAMHIANGRRGRAEKVLEDAWKVEPHPMLADVYRQVVNQVSADKQLNLAKGLADKRPDNAESRFLVASFAMAAEKWGDARKALEPLTRQHPDARVCRLMAEIEMHGFNDADAAREWLARSASASPEPAWVCNQTGAVQAEWSAVCNESKLFGTLEWRVPHHLVPALPTVLSVQSSGSTNPPAVSRAVIVDAIAEPAKIKAAS